MDPINRKIPDQRDRMGWDHPMCAYFWLHYQPCCLYIHTHHYAEYASYRVQYQKGNDGNHSGCGISSVASYQKCGVESALIPAFLTASDLPRCYNPALGPLWLTEMFHPSYVELLKLETTAQSNGPPTVIIYYYLGTIPTYQCELYIPRPRFP